MMMTSEILWYPHGGRLVVAMPETGTLIRCEHATDTFVEVIKRIGIEHVRGLEKISGTELISIIESNTPLGLDPMDLKRRLTRIAEHLGISLCIELFPQRN